MASSDETWPFSGGPYYKGFSDPDPDEGFKRQISHMSVRGMVLTSAAVLDQRLEATLRAWLTPDEKALKDAFSERGAFGSLDAKIKAAYLMGVFGPTIYAELTTMARIRNRFAHEAEVHDFGHPKVSGLADNLRFYQLLLDWAENDGLEEARVYLEAAHRFHFRPNDRAERYLGTALFLSAIIELKAVEPPERPKPGL